MIVLCKFSDNKEVPELIEKYGYEPDTILHITKDKEYHVYGMIGWVLGKAVLPSLSYIIRDDLGYISNYDANLFQVVDSKLSNVDWHFSYGKNGAHFILGYDEFVNNNEHYDSAILRDEPGCSALLRWCDSIDNLEKPHETSL